MVLALKQRGKINQNEMSRLEVAQLGQTEVSVLANWRSRVTSIDDKTAHRVN